MVFLAMASGLNRSEWYDGALTLRTVSVGGGNRIWMVLKKVMQFVNTIKKLPIIPTEPKAPTLKKPSKSLRTLTEPEIETKAPRANLRSLRGAPALQCLGQAAYDPVA